MLPFSSLASCIISITFKLFSSVSSSSSQSCSSLVILKMHLVIYSFCSLFMIELVRMNGSKLNNPWQYFCLSWIKAQDYARHGRHACHPTKKIVLSYKKFVYFW